MIDREEDFYWKKNQHKGHITLTVKLPCANFVFFFGLKKALMI